MPYTPLRLFFFPIPFFSTYCVNNIFVIYGVESYLTRLHKEHGQKLECKYMSHLLFM